MKTSIERYLKGAKLKKGQLEKNTSAKGNSAVIEYKNEYLIN